MQRKITYKDRLRYAIDNQFSRGPVSLILWLAILSLIVVLAAALVITLTGVAPAGETRLSFQEAAWASLMRTMDAGTMGGDTGWGFRFIMFILPTLGGVFVISTLIGILTSGIESKLEEMRKGRSRVVEQGHSVILGWSPQIFTIISELVTANENQPKSCIVIMGNKDKVDMEDEIAERVGHTGKTRIVCRNGDPIELSDLEIVSLDTAKSIIILSPESNDPDSETIKIMLAIVNHPDRRAEPYHVVAEIRDPKNMEVARMVGKDEVELILVSDLIARIIAQTCRQSGLSVVHTELLDFGGDEIYFSQQPGLTGKTFGEALLAFEDSTVIGLAQGGGAVRLNPPMDTVIASQDQVIAISQDDDTVRLSGKTSWPVDQSTIRTGQPQHANPERTLILGWNWRAPAIIRELDNYVAPGSEVMVVTDRVERQEELAVCCPDLTNQTLRFERGETTSRRVLDALQIETYHHVVILAYSDDLSPQQADSRTLVTLLHLREMSEKAGHSFSIVSEMMDVRNRNLADVAHADDYIVSEKLVSLMMAQISENKYLNPVFKDLFDPEGSEIYLKHASDYVVTGQPVNFYTVIEAARQRGEVAIGYRMAAHHEDASRAYGVVINPDKLAPVTFDGHDRVIVLAES